MSNPKNWFHGLPTVLHLAREIPLVWFLIGCLVAATGVLLSKNLSASSRTILLRNIAIGAIFIVVTIYLSMTFYSLGCYMTQSDEANILGVSAATIHGLPMYNPPVWMYSSYSLMYGPVLFLLYRMILVMGGAEHFWVLRGAIVAANLGLCTSLYLLARRFVSSFVAVALLTLPLSILLQHADNWLGLRADIWIMLCAAVSLICSFLEMELPAALLTGAACGIMIGFKLSAAPAVLFPLLILYRRFGLRTASVALLVTIVAAFAPFALPGISLKNYISWVLFTRSEGISFFFMGLNLMFAVFLIAPCLMVEQYLRRSGATFKRRIPDFIAIAICLCMAVSTSKPGSGPWYFWHIVPFIVVYLASALRCVRESASKERELLAYFIAVACVVLACANAPRAYANLQESRMPPNMGQARQEIARYLALYSSRSSIQMGYGSVPDDVSTSLRYLLVYQGQPYTLEGNTGRFETVLLPFPVNIQTRMSDCKDDVWLVPHAQAPFSFYLFPPSLHDVFIRHYEIDRTDAIYDAWVCNGSGNHHLVGASPGIP